MVATLGCVLPSTVIVIVLVKLYMKYRDMSVMKGVMSGLRPAVVAMIASAGLSILTLALWQGNAPSLDARSFDFVAAGIFVLALAVLRIFKVNQIYVMAAAGVVGFFAYMYL